MLRSRETDLSGILNGIEDDVWDPATDPLLPQPYSSLDISGKRVCKAHLQSALGLTVAADRPLVGYSSRLTHQKMADILIESVPDILARGAQLAVMGDGDPELEAALPALQSRYPGQMAYRPFSEALSHRLQAGADILLAPARYEPCGLIQLYALRYGTVPVVRRTGGLADTVTDAGPVAMLDDTATGFVFDEPSKEALLAALSRAMIIFKEPLAWRRLQLAGMRRDFGWKASAMKYLDLYEGLSGLSRPAQTVYDRQKGWGSLQREIRSVQGGLT
jgi:starch synthase